MLDLAIINGTVVTAAGTQAVDVGVTGGRIALLAGRGDLPPAAETVDAAGKLVLPGAIDSHFHCRAPANPEREDFASGSRAAAAGGATTILEMPISIPPTTNGATLAARRAHAERDSYVDYGFYSSMASLDQDDVDSALAEGAVAFKAFLQEVPPGREAEFTGICLYHHDDILRSLELVGPTGTPAVFHAEDYETYTLLEQRLKAAGRTDVAAHWEWRPDYVEAIAISTLLLLAEAIGTHVHLPHISSALAAGLIRDAKRRGVPVTAETCPQYLALDHDTLRRHGPFAKCNPPLKTPADNAALWEALADGTIDTVATDHSPFTVPEKEVGWRDIWAAPPGFPGADILTPFMLTAALDGRLPLARAVELITSAPAAIFNLSPRKGTVAPGSDADLVVYDPEGRYPVDLATWQSRSAAMGHVWAGYDMAGRVERTIVRGRTVYLDGRITGEPGYGEALSPIVAAGREAVAVG